MLLDYYYTLCLISCSSHGFIFLSAVSETLWKDPIEFREDKKGGPLAAMYLIYGPYVKRECDYIYIHTNYSA